MRAWQLRHVPHSIPTRNDTTADRQSNSLIRSGSSSLCPPFYTRASMPSLVKSSLLDVFLRTWYLGFTSFGGPVVHFQIFHRMFVEGQNPWLDEQTVRVLPSASSFLGSNDNSSQFQELFAICQALPGPGSTKVGFCIAFIRGGFLAAVMFFLTWR